MLNKYNKYVNIPGAQDVNVSRAPVAPSIPGPFSCSVTSCTIHIAAAVLVILMEAILYLLVEESKKEKRKNIPCCCYHHCCCRRCLVIVVVGQCHSDGCTRVFCVSHRHYVMYLVNRGQVVVGMTQYCSIWARDQMVRAQF